MSAAEATILLLAAGRSSRMQGRDKLMEDIDGEPLVRRMARRALRTGVPVRVVLGADHAARRAALEGLDLQILEATGQDGMAASIRAGVAGVTGPVLLVLADMPEITASDLHLMLSLGAQAPDAILRAASQDGRPGHPVLFPADLVPELAAIRGDMGARDILRAAAARVHLLPLEGERALIDLDTPGDWADWRAKRGG
jgi:CTP:molybdopterin cytidylyltransferase MocA